MEKLIYWLSAYKKLTSSIQSTKSEAAKKEYTAHRMNVKNQIYELQTEIGQPYLHLRDVSIEKLSAELLNPNKKREEVVISEKAAQQHGVKILMDELCDLQNTRNKLMKKADNQFIFSIENQIAEVIDNLTILSTYYDR